MTDLPRVQSTDETGWLADRLAEIAPRVGATALTLGRSAEILPVQTLTDPARLFEKVRTSKSGSREDQRPVPEARAGFLWNADDGATAKWRPQGITSIASSESGRGLLVVSWYRREGHPPDQGLRFSFVDVERSSYEHVLLVEPQSAPEPADNARFRALPGAAHAGGIAAVGSTIFVADEFGGIRAFDAGAIFEADPALTGTGLGEDGSIAAYGYRYIMPQRRFYRLDIGKGRGRSPNVSYLSIHRAEGCPERLVSGNYYRPFSSYDLAPTTLTQWSLSGSRIESPAAEATRFGGLNNFLRGTGRMAQGAQLLDGELWLSTSGGNARLRRRTANGKWHSWPWPYGLEDLHHHPDTGELWSLTEWEPVDGVTRRLVYSVDPTAYAA